MNKVMEWLDNPIFVKHARSRLRKGQLVPAVAAVLVVCLLIGWAGYMLNWYVNGRAFGALLVLETILLVIIGANQVSASVGSARESGIIDFHRVSPMSSLELVFGFFFGAPVLQYVLFACTLPFALFCAATGVPTALNLIQMLLTLVLLAWLMHAISLLNALMFKWRKGRARGASSVVLFIFCMNYFIASGFRSTTLLLETGPVVDFFGVTLPWFVFMLLYVIPALFFLLVPCVRKMRSERAHAYSKPQALACMTTAAVLLAGGVPGGYSYESHELSLLYAILVAGLVLVCTITPSRAEYAKSVRRALKEGRMHLGPWDDLALNRIALAALCGILLVATTLSWQVVGGPAPKPVPALALPPGLPPGAVGGPPGGVVTYPGMAPPAYLKPVRLSSTNDYSYGISIAVGVLVLAYFGLALQFFWLFFPQRNLAVAAFALFLFLVWLVPLVVAWILMAASWPEEITTAISSLSPVYGIASSVGVGARAHGQTAQLAALLPALGFVYLFNNLLGRVRRRIDGAVRAAMEKPKAEPQAQAPAGELAEV